MGYTTHFSGQFDLDKPLTIEHKKTLEDFAESRHDNDEQIAEGLPSFYCQWVPSYDGKQIVWDERENFYYYDQWIQVLLEKFLIPWGYVVNGAIKWDGEETEDMGQIIIKDNKITIYDVVIKFEKRK